MSIELLISGLTIKKGYSFLIHDLSFTLMSGQGLCLFGANGVGKTSLLRTIAGFTRPVSGNIVFSLHNQTLDPLDMTSLHLHCLGHSEGLNMGRTVAAELSFQAEYLGASPKNRHAAIEELNLGPLLALETRNLSAGQKRRLALARLWMAPRLIWLLDEPMAPLDLSYRERLTAKLKAHLNQGGVFICAVHEPLPISVNNLVLTRPDAKALEGLDV